MGVPAARSKLAQGRAPHSPPPHPSRGKARCHQRLSEPRSQVSTGPAGQGHAWEAPLSQPEEGCPLGGKQEGQIQTLHRASRVWLPWSQRKSAVIPLRSTVKGWGGGVPSPSQRGEIPLGDCPSPQAEFLQPAGPFSSTRGCGCAGLSLSWRLPRPCPILPSSRDRKVSVALTRPLDLRSCSQNNPLASPASFRVGGVFQTGLVPQPLGVAGGMRKGS